MDEPAGDDHRCHRRQGCRPSDRSAFGRRWTRRSTAPRRQRTSRRWRSAHDRGARHQSHRHDRARYRQRDRLVRQGDGLSPDLPAHPRISSRGAGGSRDLRREDAARLIQAHLLSANGVRPRTLQFVDLRSKRRRTASRGTRPASSISASPTRTSMASSHGSSPTAGASVPRSGSFFPAARTGLSIAEDPFGNVIEAFTHSYAETFANMPGWHDLGDTWAERGAPGGP